MKKSDQELPLKVTLVWYDYAAHDDAREISINDLDLEGKPMISRDLAAVCRAAVVSYC